MRLNPLFDDMPTTVFERMSGLARVHALADQAVKAHGAAGIPVSAFMSSPTASGVLRLCFAKSDAVLEEAARRLGRAWRAG